MFDFSTTMVYEMEPKYGDKTFESKEGEQIKDPNQYYDDIAEEFLDAVFETESKLEDSKA